MTMTQAGPDVRERAVVPDLSVRSDGRTVYGIAMPFDAETIVNDGYGPYTEIFRKGSFAKTLRERADRIKLCINHDKLRRLPIGKASALREDGSGLYGEFRVSRTSEGEEALTLIRDGVLDSFSVGFIPVNERKVSTAVIERTEVMLREVSVVAFPAYDKAVIQGLRSSLGVSDEELERLIELVRHQPDLLTLLGQETGRPVTALPTRSDDTPEEGAVSVPDDGSEPADATRDEEPDPESTPDSQEGTGEESAASHDRSLDEPVSAYQPAQRPPISRERRQAQRGMVQAILARAHKE